MGSNIKINKKIILFDGFCNLCNPIVKIILKLDKNKKFYFSSLNSSFSKKILNDKIDKNFHGKTIILYTDDKIYIKSKAVFQIIYLLGGYLKFFLFLKLIPYSILDRIYNIISKYRYDWFGKSKTCFVPNKETSDRFIND
jgi:predicted DCC family thiol-disulfide oxidoreductase YuxK|tara:strand:+ start:11896 stop:12315 length:420 start_codon:yes stop_codon:yes gene_type:complete